MQICKFNDVFFDVETWTDRTVDRTLDRPFGQPWVVGQGQLDYVSYGTMYGQDSICRFVNSMMCF